LARCRTYREVQPCLATVRLVRDKPSTLRDALLSESAKEAVLGLRGSISGATLGDRNVCIWHPWTVRRFCPHSHSANPSCAAHVTARRYTSGLFLRQIETRWHQKGVSRLLPRKSAHVGQRWHSSWRFGLQTACLGKAVSLLIARYVGVSWYSADVHVFVRARQFLEPSELVLRRVG